MIPGTARRGLARRAVLLAVSAMIATTSPARAAEPVVLHAAGSLRSAMTRIAEAFTGATGIPVRTEFGPSGLLRGRLAAGEAGGVFASANLEHPRQLAQAGKAGPVVVFARNRLCALAGARSGLTGTNLLDRLLDPGLRVATSTPGADPAGDYTWAMFGRAEAIRPGSRAILEAKALKLAGGADTPPPPPGRSVYAAAMEGGRTDVFLTYCTNAREAAAQVPGLEVVDLPAELAVGADYGLTVLTGAPPEAQALALFVLSVEGQRLLSGFGFTPVALPASRTDAAR